MEEPSAVAKLAMAPAGVLGISAVLAERSDSEERSGDNSLWC
jgi:hypothetical protein